MSAMYRDQRPYNVLRDTLAEIRRRERRIKALVEEHTRIRHVARGEWTVQLVIYPQAFEISRAGARFPNRSVAKAYARSLAIALDRLMRGEA